MRSGGIGAPTASGRGEAEDMWPFSWRPRIAMHDRRSRVMSSWLRE